MTAAEPPVLIISPWYPNVERPNTGVFVRDHAEAAALHHPVAVLHVTDSTRSGLWRDPSEELPTWRLSVAHRVPKAGRIEQGLAVMAAVRSVAKEWRRPSVVHAHVHSVLLPALAAAKRCGAVLVATEHSSALLPADPTSMSFVERRVARAVWARAAEVVAVSETLARPLRQASGRSVVVIPNPVDTTTFLPAQVTPGPPYRLVSVASQTPGKRIDLLIRALAKLRAELPVELDVYGDGPLRQQIAALVESLSLGGAVRLHGNVPRSQVAARVAASHLFVSTSAFETFSVAVAEGLCCGVPVVTTRSGGAEELVSPRSGVVVAEASADAISAALAATIRRLHEFDRSKIAACARSRYSMESLGTRLRELYQAALNVV